MGMINNNADLKAANSAVNADLDFESIASFVLDAQIIHLVPAIGQATYTLLSATGLSGQNLIAQQLLQKAEGNFALSAFVNYGSVQISESGLHVIQDDKRKIASDKKVTALRRQSLRDGYQALEAAVNYLEANLSFFTAYAADAAHLENRRYFINTAAEFNTGFFIDNNAHLFNALKAIMEGVEEDYIQPALQDYSDTLRAAVLAGTTSAIQKTLLRHIAKVVAPFTIREAIPYRMIEIDVNGVVTNSSGEGGMNSGNTELQQTAGVGVLQMAMLKADEKGKNQMAKLRQFMNDNAVSFPGYTTVDTLSSSKINNVPRGTYFL